MSKLDVVRFMAEKPGPKVLILGAVHGNEPAGTKAAIKVIEFLNSKTLNKGLVTFVPVCNPAAKQHDVRFIKDNLNRILNVHLSANTLEKDYANQICKLIDNHDYVLDLHSTHLKGDLPTVFNDFVDDETTAWSNNLGVETIITSWRDMLDNSEAPADFSDTVYYAHKQGKKALLVEAGYHNDSSAENVAYKAIIKTLENFDIIDKTANDDIKHNIAHMYKIVFKKEGLGNFAKQWKHMDEVRAGETVAKLENGKALIAEHNGYVVIPFPEAKPGEEWFYLAKK